MEPERTRDELLDELVRMTRARDMLAETADRLIAERDRYRFALIDAANDIEEIAMCVFDSSRRQAIEAALERIRTALTAEQRRKQSREDRL